MKKKNQNELLLGNATFYIGVLIRENYPFQVNKQYCHHFLLVQWVARLGQRRATFGRTDQI